ncbi:hypothetical protein [Nannocystis sp.]|uniref:hypothetical protein n=1 Tax=Nannocystis sp. TaxID=1962667 RepID=UPI0024229A42|nr:hypothetical protein [Nannocystis sp.]MBK7828833.1 hypothetical protein [Nannocystis sp.]MBK9756542.1 hypothetical protein [Nannocystis sp.]
MRLGRLALALGLFASACAGFNVGSDEGCAAACASAHACGFLPSGLGYGPTSDAALADCERRCGQSPRDDDDITQILSCLDGSWETKEELTAWCLDSEESDLAGDLTCATAVRCFATEFKGSRLQGDVHIEVSLISLDDFVTAFDDDALTELYAAPERVLSSCAEALCGHQDCADDSTDHPCDATLCGQQRVNIGSICSEQGARVIEIDVQGRRGPPVTQVLLDDSEGSSCKESTLTFTAEDYNVEPGPARASARIGGRLPASELARIGVTAVDDEEGSADYCLRFPGMTRTLRAGQNVLLVPVGTIDELVAAGLRPRGCDE